MKRIQAILAAAAMTVSAFAQDNINDVVAVILDNNPQLHAEALLVRADALDNADGNSLANPSVDFARVWGRHGIGNKLQLDVSQEFSWPGLYSARSKAADVSSSAALCELEAAKVETRLQATDLLIELVYVRRQLGLFRELEENFRMLSEAIEEGVEHGEVTIIDRKKMEIEFFEIKESIIQTTAREQQIITSLQAMSSVPLCLDGITAYPATESHSLGDYIDNIQYESAVVAQRLQGDVETQNARVASMGRYPSFSVGYQHQAEMGDRFNGFTVSMTLPVFEGRHARRAALDRRDAAELAMTDLENKRRAEVESLFADLTIQRERMETYNRVFGDNTYPRLLLMAYQGGEISVIDYLSEIHYYHQNMLTYFEAEYNYHTDLANLTRN